MYGEAKLSVPTSQPEHLEIATKMANEITERFSPTEQNQVVKHIYSLVKERRHIALKETEERCNFLNQTLQELG